MNKARIFNTNEIVKADMLLELYPNYRELEFVCLDEQCSVRMAPACISKKDHRKPHFKKYRNREHIDTCKYAILNELYQVGKNQKLNITQIKKIGYPSVFNLNEDDSEIKQVKTTKARLNSQDEGITGKGGIATTYEFDSENIKFDRKNRVQGIDRIVDWYLGFPYNRDVEIEINNTKIQYRYLFKKIDSNTDPSTLRNDRIFYGRLRLSVTNKGVFDKYSDKVLFTMLGYKSKDKSSDSIDNYKVKINKDSLSKYSLSRLKNKYNSLFEKALEEFQTNSVDPNIGLYVFVYGRIDENNNILLNEKNIISHLDMMKSGRQWLKIKTDRKKLTTYKQLPILL
ncbi:hypothetical protein OGH69_09005 [Flavobacterium sp. MFBS3-15]|uniref:hypothetical protein n=1 Tax=Flavobacterium sp. MFBS3-15 TaxID=2989816 RepID=UPI0022364A54|nr:hypothetical protein [Flavobacterium sp. MFBS3-15]MCW4469100.1 hypothetical protein [Flavobacterium sp. MFBS3-15]